jgi:hypothetical protein
MCADRSSSFRLPPAFDLVMSVLTTSTKASPFPYAAAAAATLTSKADIVFEDESVPTTLDLDGVKIEGEEAIVLALTKAGGLSGDSSKVSFCDGPILKTRGAHNVQSHSNSLSWPTHL